MIETPTLEETKPVMLEVPRPVTLEDVLPDARKLSVADKLALIRILAEDLVIETNTSLTIPPGVYEFYTPYEIDGITEDMIERFESLPKPMMAQDAN